MLQVPQKHPHYHKPVPPGAKTIDIYRVLVMFGVTDPCLQHAAKKILCAGQRGAGKEPERDVQEAIDTLTRWQEMRREEDEARAPTFIEARAPTFSGIQTPCCGD